MLTTVKRIADLEFHFRPKNHFVLPATLYAYPKASGHFHAYTNEQPKLPPFKSVSYTFDMRDIYLDPWDLKGDMKDEDMNGHEGGDDTDARFSVTQIIRATSLTTCTVSAKVLSSMSGIKGVN